MNHITLKRHHSFNGFVPILIDGLCFRMLCFPKVNLDEGRECAICMMEIQKAAKTEDVQVFQTKIEDGPIWCGSKFQNGPGRRHYDVGGRLELYCPREEEENHGQ